MDLCIINGISPVSQAFSSLLSLLSLIVFFLSLSYSQNPRSLLWISCFEFPTAEIGFHISLLMASAPLNKIDTAHQMYRDGKYEQALGFYADALSMAKTKLQKIALHSNRAACFLKLHDFKNVISFFLISFPMFIVCLGE